MTTANIEELDQYREAALQELKQASDTAALEVWFARHLSQSGEASLLKRQIGKVPKDQRAAVGKRVNLVSRALAEAFSERREAVQRCELEERIRRETVDVTLPTRSRRVGRLHPVTQTLREILWVFQTMGFHVFETPHVERDDYNFGLLNMPPDHPARDMQDTFYVDDERLLRTHTSAGQIRAMRAYAPGPVRVVLPGLCYRFEDVTPRSEIQFYQVEGLIVGPEVRFSDLKGALTQFARLVFGADQEIRLRGSYFPFTEPSVEVDIRCTLCHGSGCRVCKHSGWLELLGAGLVHPVVLENGGYDPDRVRGIAFGMGIERTVLLRHGIDDIRYFYQNDLRLLQQF